MVGRGEQAAAVEQATAVEPSAPGVGYLRRLLGYAHKVYALGAVLERVREGRVRPRIAMATVARTVFACGLFRVRSFNALEPQLGEAPVRHALGLEHGGKPGPLCSVDTLARALRRADPESFHAMLAALIQRAERNKVLREGWIGALRYVALDGWEPIASRHRHCAQCLEREIQDGKQRVIEYYHRYVVALLLGPHEEVVLGFEPMRNRWARQRAGELEADQDAGVSAFGGWKFGPTAQADKRRPAARNAGAVRGDGALVIAASGGTARTLHSGSRRR